MAQTGSRSDPFVAFRFEVQIDGLPVAGFSDCTGLNYEIETMDYLEGGLNDHVWKFRTRGRQSNIVLKRGIVDRELWSWFVTAFSGRVIRRSGVVTVKDAAGADDTLRFEFRQAMPVKWTGPELAAAASTVAMESVELAHHGLERLL
jgi:phage tail-like protein